MFVRPEISFICYKFHLFNILCGSIFLLFFLNGECESARHIYIRFEPVLRSRSQPEPINLAGAEARARADKKGPAPAGVHILHKKIIFTIHQGWAPRSFGFRTHRSFAFIFRTKRSFAFIFRVFGDL